MHFKVEQKGLENLSDIEKYEFEKHVEKIKLYKAIKSDLIENNNKLVYHLCIILSKENILKILIPFALFYIKLFYNSILVDILI